MRLDYVTTLWVEGKQMHILCEPDTLSTQEMRRQATKYRRWETVFTVCTDYILPCRLPLPTSPIDLSFISNGH